MEKKRVLMISGIATIIILIAVLINIIIVIPLTVENTWIYGIYIMIAGLIAYFAGLFLLEGYRLESIGTIIIIIGEIFIITYFAIILETIWVSIFIIFPAITFSVLIIIAYYYSKEILPNRNSYNISLMLISGSFFFLMVEAAFRIPIFFQETNMPIWAFIIIAVGLMLYVFTTWKILEKPSYIMALTGAFTINIGILMIELHYRLQEITGIYMIIFLPPAAIFLVLTYVNYKISPYE